MLLLTSPAWTTTGEYKMGLLNHQINLVAQAWKYFVPAIRPPQRLRRLSNMIGANLAAVVGHPYRGQPLRAYFHITNQCNNRCIICEPHKDGSYQGDSLDFKHIVEAKNVFPLLTSACFVGDGEPLLHPRTIEGITIFAERNCWVNMTSNGILLTRKKTEELTKAGLSEIQISMDGASDETISLMRPNTDPQRLKDSIAYLINYSQRTRKRKVVTLISMCITNRNMHDIEPFVTMARNIGVDAIRFQNFIPFKGTDLQLTSDEAEDVRRRVYQLITKTQNGPTIYYDDLNFSEKNIFAFIKARCVHPYFNISIKPDGNVYPCCGLTKPIGNLNESCLKSIYKSRARQDFLKRIASDSPPKECFKCVWLRRDNLKKR